MTHDADNIPTSPIPPPSSKGAAGVPTGAGASEAATSGAPAFRAPTVAELAPAFPNLEILEPLGQGGMGAVYKARQTALNRVVALKILPPGRGSELGFAERFTREAQSLAKLNHPNIVSVFDSGQVSTPAGVLYYFVMEYVDGPNLRSLIRGGHVKSSQAVDLIRQVCDALAYAHEEGVVHRDIKPENVLLDARLRIKVADFGLAKLLSREPGASTLTRADAVMGTLQYMAPEQIEKPLEVGPPADLYATGVMLYEMLTGELPMGRFEAPSVRGADARLDAIVFRALEKSPSRRYASAGDMRAALEVLSTRTTVVTTAAPAAPGWGRTLAWLGPLVGVVGAAGLLFMMKGRTPEAPPAAPPVTPAPPGKPQAGGREHGRRLVEFRGSNIVLADRAVQSLGLAPADRGKVEMLIRTTVAAGVQLERRHSKVSKTEGGHVRIEIGEYAKEGAEERAKFARELSGMLTEKQRLALSSGRPVGELTAEKGQGAEEFAAWVEDSTTGAFDELFSGSEAGRTLEIWRDGETYHLADSTAKARGKDPEQTGLSPSVIPPRYRPYWVLYGSESADLAELVAELGKDPGGRRRPAEKARLAERIRTLPNGESRVRKLLEDAGMEAPASAGPAQLAVKLEQLARSLQGLPELEDTNPK